MPEYLAPGVYVEEVDTGSKPIEGVSTSTSGFVGMTVRGATSGLPTLVTSFPDFVSKFGGYLGELDLSPDFQGHTYLPYAVDGFFNNGGKRLYVMRVPGKNSSKASTTTTGGLVTRLKADTEISNPRKLFLTTLRGIQVGTKLRLRMVKDSIVTDSPELTVSAIDNREQREITVGANISTILEFKAKFTTVYIDINGIDNNGIPTQLSLTTLPPPQPPSFIIQAKNEGSWGRDITITASHESSARAEVEGLESGANNNNKIRLKSTANFYEKAWVEIDRNGVKLYRRVKSVNGKVLILEGPLMNATDIDPPAGAQTILSSCEFRLALTYNGTVEQFSGLTLENVPGRYFFDQINNASSLISVNTITTATHPFFFPSGGDGLRILLDTNGINGTPPDNDDYKGRDLGPGKRTGIKALEDIDQISIIAAPGRASQVVQEALINQCEVLKDRFAILDPEPKTGDIAPNLGEIEAQRNNYDTKYAAIYYPRLLVYDPVTKIDIKIPPSGHMAGIYARSDIERGVYKAPANEVIRGITGLELTINKGEQDILNPSPLNINVLRDFRSAGRGYRVWGARVITSDPDWKYVNVRRLFIFIEESIDQGTQWVVFEPNDEQLWARVKRVISAFLTQVWRDGALMGLKPEQAFFVKCDRTTMTQNDIDNGRLIVLIGIAPVKPAEFVIFRIGQWTGGAAQDN